jgi:hypothetical protein
MSWFRAGLVTMLLSTLVMVAAAVLLSVVDKGADAKSIAALVLFGLPLAALAAAPICLVILPITDAVLERSGLRLFRDLALSGAVAGALLPVIVMFVLRLRPPGMAGTILGLALLGGFAAGGAAGLFYAEMIARLGRR